MPLTSKGSKILAAMKDKYGGKKGKSVFYASANKGTIAGVHGMGKKKRRRSIKGIGKAIMARR
jgi:hypothetical protein